MFNGGVIMATEALFNETMFIAGCGVVIYFYLLWANRNNRSGCYAPVELSGVLCILPEIITALILSMPILAWTVISGVQIIVTMVYFAILYCLRKISLLS